MTERGGDQEHLRKGAAHWNSYVEHHEGNRVDFSLAIFEGPLDLSDYNFPVPAIFYGCEFKGSVKIKDVTCESWINFSEATFENGIFIANSTFDGEVDFESARVEGPFMVDGSHFKHNAKFEDIDVTGRLHISDSTIDGDLSLSELGAYGGLILSGNKCAKEVTISGMFQKEALLLSNQFEGLVDFKQADFEAPLILRGNSFKVRPIIDQVQLAYLPIMPEDEFKGGLSVIADYYRFLHKLKRIHAGLARTVARTLFVAQTEESYPTLRQFRLFAKEYDDHRLALELYALEQKSRRIWYDRTFSSGFILGLVYQLLSDFGRSILRPIIYLLSSFIAFSLMFYAQGVPGNCAQVPKIKSSILISVNNSLPFLGWSKQGMLSVAEHCLFLGAPPLQYALLSMLQTTISLVLIFLFGLAIRNALKMHS